MGFSDSPSKSLLLSAEKDAFLPPSRSAKELQELRQIAPSNYERVIAAASSSCTRFDDRKMEEAAAGTSSGVVLFPCNLKVKLPEETVVEVAEEEEVVDGLSTPTSMANKIPSLDCPPAPRKPKSAPSAVAAAKRNKGCRKRVFLDLTNEIESMLPAAIRADFGNKIKKVRKES